MPRTSGRKEGKAKDNAELPNIYRDMLADTQATTLDSDGEARRAKRRRIGGRVVLQEHSPPEKFPDKIDELFGNSEDRSLQIAETSSDDSAQSDVCWEEVVLDNESETISADDSTNPVDSQKIDITLESKNVKSVNASGLSKRKPLTAAERTLRLRIHKMHLCCMMVHIHMRNHWCNDIILHTSLRRLLTLKTISYLNPNEDASQFQRSRSFMTGLEEASEAFRGHFRITKKGLRRPSWLIQANEFTVSQRLNHDMPIQKVDFMASAVSMSGTRDIGAQLFCALLRAGGVDARLVCSIPTFLIHDHVPAAGLQHHHVHVAQDVHKDAKDRDHSEAQITPAEVEFKQIRRPLKESRYPVYWVEALNESLQKWIPVDPLVTKTIAKPSRFEPPRADPANNMSYVFAFEEDYYAYDVTRRYCKAYNSKTRKDRVDASLEGTTWLRRVMNPFRRHTLLQRDEIEQAELSAKEAAEPMPRNVQDFKDHPYYALERHLRRREVIHPRREVGRLSTGRGHASNNVELIYRRKDVISVQSADKWYRNGRIVKSGEQPLKRIRKSKSRNNRTSSGEEDQDNTWSAMYALEQTILYEAPPVVDGKVPRNMFGNLDIYAPNMIPRGGTYLTHLQTAKAARVLKIDYAEVVTGFSFKGRHGTAIVCGAVVPTEKAKAVSDLLNQFDTEAERAADERKSSETISLWRRFITGLRIRQRIEGYDIEGQRDENLSVLHDVEVVSERGLSEKPEEADNDGGFMPEPQAHSSTTPSKVAPNSAIPGTYHTRGSASAPTMRFHLEDFNVLEALSGNSHYGTGGRSVSSHSFAASHSSHVDSDLGGENIGVMNRGQMSLPTPAPVVARVDDFGNDEQPYNAYGSFERMSVDQNHIQAAIKNTAGSSIQDLSILSRRSPEGAGHDLSQEGKEEDETSIIPIAAESSSEMDASSLLSRDPEEEEIDPDWVA